jgi:hypothetical protein
MNLLPLNLRLRVCRILPPGQRARPGFNVIELLIITGILGIILLVTLPVLQHTRETARRVECYNHLMLLSLACAEHQATLGHFPTGGWPGPQLWIGDSDCGYGKRQPGGWTYNILPFMEHKALHDRGMRTTTLEKRSILAGTAQSPLGVYYCPSRRPPMLYPVSQVNPWMAQNINPITAAARSDYAANGLDADIGVIFANSIVSIKDIRDGLSHTYLLGEKYLIPDHYKDGMAVGDNLPAYANFFCDWQRGGATPPERDRRGKANYTGFGSAHALGFNMSFCDSSARTISYDIDPVMHARLCDRRDGRPATIPQP